MKESYEIINIVYLHTENTYGTVEKMGAFASVVKYTKDGIEYEEEEAATRAEQLRS